MTQAAAAISPRDIEAPSSDFSRVPYSLYTDQRIFDLEQERIFRGPTWSYLGLEAEVKKPGDFIIRPYAERRCHPRVLEGLLRHHGHSGPQPADGSMTMTSMQTLETELRISRLNREYGRCLDETRFGEWPGFFEGEDAVYIIHPRENADAGLEGYWMYCANKPMIRDRILALQNANLYNIHYDRHLISDSYIVGEKDGIFDVRTNYCVIQTDVEGRSEVFSAGEYRDKVVIVNGEPKFKQKIVVPDTFNIQRPLAVPL